MQYIILFKKNHALEKVDDSPRCPVDLEGLRGEQRQTAKMYSGTAVLLSDVVATIHKRQFLYSYHSS